jgi:hypothetical protein
MIRAQYPQPALVPASPWLDSIPPDRPKLTLDESRAGLRFEWETTGGNRRGCGFCNSGPDEVWTTEILKMVLEGL